MNSSQSNINSNYLHQPLTGLDKAKNSVDLKQATHATQEKKNTQCILANQLSQITQTHSTATPIIHNQFSTAHFLSSSHLYAHILPKNEYDAAYIMDKNEQLANACIDFCTSLKNVCQLTKTIKKLAVDTSTLPELPGSFEIIRSNINLCFEIAKSVITKHRYTKTMLNESIVSELSIDEKLLLTDLKLLQISKDDEHMIQNVIQLINMHAHSLEGLINNIQKNLPTHRRSQWLKIGLWATASLLFFSNSIYAFYADCISDKYGANKKGLKIEPKDISYLAANVFPSFLCGLKIFSLYKDNHYQYKNFFDMYSNNLISNPIFKNLSDTYLKVIESNTDR